MLLTYSGISRPQESDAEVKVYRAANVSSISSALRYAFLTVLVLTETFLRQTKGHADKNVIIASFFFV